MATPNDTWSSQHIVLAVDDEPGIIRLCKRLLERAAFQVLASTDPRQGLAILEKSRVDLLLVDIRMPEMDGFHLIDQARHNRPELAVVVMTGFGTVETAIEALRRGADGLILKPFSGAELVQSVRRALEERQQKRDIMLLQALRPLFDVTESLFTERNPKRLQSLILDTICGHLKSNHAEFYRRDTPGRGAKPRLRLAASVFPPGRDQPGKTNHRGLLSDSLVRQVYVFRVPLLIHHEGPGDSKLQEILTTWGLSSVICAPVALKTEAQVSGVLLAARVSGEPIFREADLEMLTILARQAAVALENARLHAELRDYIRQVEDSQRALIRAEKMAIAGRLTASIAHEINNPLQAVQNCLHLTERDELSPQERQEYLEMARSELERLMHTVQRMLDFYRPGGVDRKPVDLNTLLEKVLSLLEKQFADHNVRLRLDLSPNLPPVLAVGDQIQQVFLNLILNSIEAMPDDGEIFIHSTTQVTPDGKTEVEMTFEDTGPGIPPGRRKNLFEPFVSTKEKGTGLGLAVSYGIITAHGGNLDLVDGQDTETRGACFRVTIPVVEDT